MPALNRLRDILVPPAAPKATGNAEGWCEAEKQLGVTLPESYKSLLELYGTGSVNGFLWLLSPFAQNRHLNLFYHQTLESEALPILERYKAQPRVAFPAVGGVLPWAMTDNGDVISWVIGPRKQKWPVMVRDCAAAIWQEFFLECDEFLLSCLNRSITVKAFPDDWLDGPPRFASVDCL